MELDPKHDDYDFLDHRTRRSERAPGTSNRAAAGSVSYQLRLMLEAEGFTKRLDTLTLLRKPDNLSDSRFARGFLFSPPLFSPARATQRTD